MPEIALPTKGTQDQIKTTVDTILVQVNNKTAGKTLQRRYYLANGVFTPPAGVTEVFVTGCGGGGSGAVAVNSSTIINGIDGGNSAFGYLVIKGGKGGRAHATDISLALPGLPGGKGGQASAAIKYQSGLQTAFSDGGDCGPHFGGRGSHYGEMLVSKDGDYGSGGGAFTALPVGANTGGFATGGGGSEYLDRMPVTVTPLSPLSIAIGSGGARAVSSNGLSVSGAGGPGYIIVEWWQ